MEKIINRIYGFLAALGLGAIVTDLTGLTEIPDTTGAQVLSIIAIVAAVLWRNLPDQDDITGPDVLSGKGLDFKVWAANIWKSFRPSPAAASAVLLFPLAVACGAGISTSYARACTPAYSDNCLVIDFSATDEGAELEIVEKPDVSFSIEVYSTSPGITAFGSAVVDPKAPSAEAEACINILFWERCAEASTEE